MIKPRPPLAKHGPSRHKRSFAGEKPTIRHPNHAPDWGNRSMSLIPWISSSPNSPAWRPRSIAPGLTSSDAGSSRPLMPM